MPDTLSCVALMAPENRDTPISAMCCALMRACSQSGATRPKVWRAMLHALAHRVDSRVVGLQRVVDQDAAIAGQVGLLRQIDVGPHADGHDHQVRGHFLAVIELHAGNALVAEDASVFARMRNRCRVSPAPPSAAHRAEASSWRSMSVSSRCTTVTCMPRSERPWAASSPSNPPPMTTARRPAPERSSIRFDVVDDRETSTTPASPCPATAA